MSGVWFYGANPFAHTRALSWAHARVLTLKAVTTALISTLGELLLELPTFRNTRSRGGAGGRGAAAASFSAATPTCQKGLKSPAAAPVVNLGPFFSLLCKHAAVSCFGDRLDPEKDPWYTACPIEGCNKKVRQREPVSVLLNFTLDTRGVSHVRIGSRGG